MSNEIIEEQKNDPLAQPSPAENACPHPLAI